jgi:sugar O-acyltransferase (sialic acid O-acetyltransferase NeuD family)
MRIAILGDGGLAREIRQLLEMGAPHREVRLFDKATQHRAWKHPWVIGVGDPQLRRAIALQAPEDAARPIDVVWVPSWGAHAEEGHGLVVQQGSVMTTGVRHGVHVVLNLGVTIGHDTAIGAYSVINPGANISGHVTIGEAVLIGAGACIREGLTIGDGAVVGMGAVVLKDVPPGEVWVGNPARRLR